MNPDALPEDELIRRAVVALFDELGPVEAARFLALARTNSQDAVAWHRQWQAGLDAEQFLNQVFGPGGEPEEHRPDASA